MNQRSSYLELLQRLKKLALLHSCSSLLNWDEETYMPSGGAEHRSEQLSLLAGLCHENLIAPEMDDLLSTLENSTFTDNPLREEAVNIRETRRLRERAVSSIPVRCRPGRRYGVRGGVREERRGR